MQLFWTFSALLCIYTNTQNLCCNEMRIDSKEVKVKVMFDVYIYVAINQVSELHLLYGHSIERLR